MQRKCDCILTIEDVGAHAEGQIFLVVPPCDWDWREVCRERGRRSGGAAESANIFPFPDNGLSELELTDLPDSLEAKLRALAQILSPAHGLNLAAAHTYTGADRARIAALDQLANRCGLPLVATGDVLYHAPHRKPLQDVLTCIREKTTIAKAGRKLEANAERHIKSPLVMARLFRGFEHALVRTGTIAAACNFSLDELVYEYPEEPVPCGRDPQTHLETLTWEGAQWRFPDGIPAHVRKTIGKELALIGELNYARYFLTVYDIVAFRALTWYPVPGARVSRQLGRLLLPRDHRRESHRGQLVVRAIHLAGTQGTTRYRCRFRA